MTNGKTANGINLLLGIWLFISPWTLSANLATGQLAANWNFWIVGAIVATVAVMALNAMEPWEEWTNLILGAWMFVSPWVLGYANSESYFWNAILVGAVVFIGAAVALPIAYNKTERVIR